MSTDYTCGGQQEARRFNRERVFRLGEGEGMTRNNLTVQFFPLHIHHEEFRLRLRYLYCL